MVETEFPPSGWWPLTPRPRPHKLSQKKPFLGNMPLGHPSSPLSKLTQILHCHTNVVATVRGSIPKSRQRDRDLFMVQMGALLLLWPSASVLKLWPESEQVCSLLGDLPAPRDRLIPTSQELLCSEVNVSQNLGLWNKFTLGPQLSVKCSEGCNAGYR